MNISTNTIINKIICELDGLTGQSRTEAIHEAMHNIHLMTGLWLDEYKTKVITTEEQPKSAQAPYVLKDQPYTEQGNDDTSIFDF